MTHLLAWLTDVLTGPRCPYPACSHRARGPRTLAAHIERIHP